MTHLLTEVAADNPASLAMLRRLGPTRVFETGLGILDVEVDLVPTGRSIAPDEPDRAAARGAQRAGTRRFRRRDTVCFWMRQEQEQAAADGQVTPEDDDLEFTESDAPG